jgi:PPK2 family polyphosphate:nucleotide phosphotransferase
MLYQVTPGSSVDLGSIDPDQKPAGGERKSDGRERLPQLTQRLTTLQELLWAEGKHKLLIVLQGIDTAGKDGTIRHVFSGLNPQGVRVASFKVPTREELARDFLWRIHRQVPAAGEITIFNRSHYEDVLIVRVHSLVPEAVWRPRYQRINEFERLLSESGTTILKFYLHIDREEQRKRLQARLDDPAKWWKFHHDDLKERKHWDDYQLAFEEMLSMTSTEWAPWYVVPANRKWYRNLLVSEQIIEALESLEMKWPEPEAGLEGLVVE